MSTVHGGRLFAIARERGWDWREVLDFSASINPLGPSSRVFEALRQSASEIVHYPESHPRDLIGALADLWNVDPNMILLGNGATDLIHFLGAAFRTETVTLCVPVFSEFHRVFPHAAQVPAGTFPEAGIAVFTRPVNPTGEMIACEEWLTRTTHPVIVDESFIEFAETNSLVEMVAARPNLIVLRSLTKFYAIPGLRVGALVASRELVELWKRQRDPWSVNVLAIRAARAAIADREHARSTLDTVRTERTWLARQLEALTQMAQAASSANFLFVRLPFAAQALTAYLEDRKILIRDCTGWPGIEGANSARVAVRTRADNEQLISHWRDFTCAS